MTPPNCPKCGDNRQVWANQITGLMTCHRIDCHTEIETMTLQTTARILATEIENEAALEANEAIQDTLNNAAAELRRLDSIEDEWARLSQDDGKAQREIERLRTAQQPAQQPLTDAKIGELYYRITNQRWSGSVSWLKTFASAIEAAHGIGSTP